MPSTILAILFIQLFLYKNVQPHIIIQNLAKVNWDLQSKNYINKDCRFDLDGKCTGFCPLTLKKCEELVNYDVKVCGCCFCKYNTTSKRCSGQCSKMITNNCISRVPNPTRDSDCVCASCTSQFIEVNNNDYYDLQYYDGPIVEPTVQLLPSCDSKTCYGHQCKSVFVSSTIHNSTSEKNLECLCLNEY